MTPGQGNLANLRSGPEPDPITSKRCDNEVSVGIDSSEFELEVAVHSLGEHRVFESSEAGLSIFRVNPRRLRDVARARRGHGGAAIGPR